MGAGIGIAFIQAILPGFIKHVARDNTSLVMGIYVAAIMAGAALSASMVPFISRLLGWQTGLASWSLLALMALVVWHYRDRTLATPLHDQDRQLSFRQMATVPRFWTLAAFFGLGTAGYTCLLAWLPPTFVTLGWSEFRAGFMLSWMSLIEVMAALAFPALSQHMNDRRPILVLVLLLSFTGFVLLSQWPVTTAWLSTALLGLGIGGLFPMSLLVTMDHFDDSIAAGQLTARVQGIGYLMASISPLVAGIMKDTLGGFEQAWLLLAIVFLGLLFLSLTFNHAEITRPMQTASL
ncbi:MFS transporter [Kushneria avicenniae]|uniref:MFS transporter n=1 Tax=Kushneria avicenniae TaxID=402385 RepID=UPI000B7ED992|nr:MFS transporter [Kushneria avicenniae]